jgi:hypothetical protein
VLARERCLICFLPRLCWRVLFSGDDGAGAL